MTEFDDVGTSVLRHGLAQDIATLRPEPVDIITASALLHEVYSYGGAYAGLHTLIRTLPSVLRPGGFFVPPHRAAARHPNTACLTSTARVQRR